MINFFIFLCRFYYCYFYSLLLSPEDPDIPETPDIPDIPENLEKIQKNGLDFAKPATKVA